MALSKTKNKQKLVVYLQEMIVVIQTAQENQTAMVKVSVTYSMILQNVQTVTLDGWELTVVLFVCMVHLMKMRQNVIVQKHVTMVLGVTSNVPITVYVIRTVQESATVILCLVGLVHTVKFQVGGDILNTFPPHEYRNQDAVSA